MAKFKKRARWAMAQAIRLLEDQGMSRLAIAARLGLSEGTVGGIQRDYEALRARYGSAQDAETSLGAGGTVESELSHESYAGASLRVAPRVLLRAAVVDVECTDFNTEGYAGYLICCCVLPLDADAPTTYRIQYEEHGDDRRLVREVMTALAEYDILIGHNLAAFDLNWLRS